MDFDAALCGSKFCPFELTQAQVDGGRVKRIDVAFKLKDVRTPFSSCLVYHAVGKVLKDSAVPAFVGLGQVAPRDMLSLSEVIALATMGFQHHNQVPQTFSV